MHLPFHHDQLKIIEKGVSFRSAFVPRTDFVDEFALSSNEQTGFEWRSSACCNNSSIEVHSCAAPLLAEVWSLMH
jgi:hypothetical protein